MCVQQKKHSKICNIGDSHILYALLLCVQGVSLSINTFHQVEHGCLNQKQRPAPEAFFIFYMELLFSSWGLMVSGFKGHGGDQRLVSVNMVCSFLTVLKPLTVSTNSSSSMNCGSRPGVRPGGPFRPGCHKRARHTFLGSLTIPLSWPDVFGSHTSSSPADFTSISWLTLRLRELTLRTPSSPWGGGTSPTGSHLASGTSWREREDMDMDMDDTRARGGASFWRGLDLPPSSCWSLWGSHYQPGLLHQVECQTGGVVRSDTHSWTNNTWGVRGTCERPHQDGVAGWVNSHGVPLLPGQAHQGGPLSGVGGRFNQDLKQIKH